MLTRKNVALSTTKSTSDTEHLADRKGLGACSIRVQPTMKPA